MNGAYAPRQAGAGTSGVRMGRSGGSGVSSEKVLHRLRANAQARIPAGMGTATSIARGRGMGPE
ncbi:hypothetical protein WS68_17940 [Burkholderia sp. TSV86]|nr:hypothetical protein WS68_17940 [Burkholderia sp. TSV86]